MTLLYRLPDTTIVALKSRVDSGEHVLVKDIASLPAAFTSDVSAIKEAIEDIGTFLLNFAQDCIVEAELKVTLGAVNNAHLARLQNLETYLLELAGAINSSRLDVALGGTLDGYLAKLVDVAANQLPPSAGPKFGQKTGINTSGDATFTSQALTHGMLVTNASTGGQSIYLQVGTSPSSSNSYVLVPGASVWVQCTNANVPLMNASSNGAVACYAGA